MSNIAVAFAVWLAQVWLHPDTTCAIRAVHAAQKPNHWWACYSCTYVKWEGRYQGVALLKCNSVWCKRVISWKGVDGGTCEKRRPRWQ